MLPGPSNCPESRNTSCLAAIQIEQHRCWWTFIGELYIFLKCLQRMLLLFLCLPCASSIRSYHNMVTMTFNSLDRPKDLAVSPVFLHVSEPLLPKSKPNSCRQHMTQCTQLLSSHFEAYAHCILYDTAARMCGDYKAEGYVGKTMQGKLSLRALKLRLGRCKILLLPGLFKWIMLYSRLMEKD